MPGGNSKKDWLLLFFLILLLAFMFQGSRGLWRPDEGRYVRCAYEMLKTGEWITPQINYKPHFSKPPVTYWLIASGLSIFGMNEWGARFFHAVAFALTALVVGLMGRRMWGRREGIAAGLIYATSLAPFIAGNIVTADTIVTCFETLAVFCFWMGLTGKDNRRQSLFWWAAMWFFFGIAFLTKGPPGLLPLAAITVFWAARKGAKRPSIALPMAGIAIFAATALPWYLIVIRRHEGLLSYFFMHEFLGRVFAGEQNRNSDWLGPIRMYLPIMIGGLMPWAILWPALLRKSRPAPHTMAWWRNLRCRPTALFLALWFFIPLFILILSKSRLPLYVLPLFAPLALATAHGFVNDILPEGFRFNKKPALAVGCIALFLLSSKFVLACVSVDRDTRAMWNGIRVPIEQKASGHPYEIVAAYGNYDGLAFYSDEDVECLGSGENSSSYIPEEPIIEEYDELSKTDCMHVFLVGERHKDAVLSELRKRGVGYSISQAPFKRSLIFCENGEEITGKSVTRLAVLGDSGTGNADQALLGSTLYHLTQSASLDAILLAGDNVAGWNGKGSPARAYKNYFEKPYAAILDVGIPFFAALGNHDVEHREYQIHYPLFHMQERRYYSRIFGHGRVEAFFLDSNTIADDRPQVEWLTEALQKSRAIWKIVIMHHPLFSTARKHHALPERMALLEPLFSSGGVDIVFCGHNHIYERLRPINGVHYMAVGSSGKLDSNSLIPGAPQRIAGNDEENVLLVLQFTDSACQFVAYTINEEPVDQGVIMHESHSFRHMLDLSVSGHGRSTFLN